MGVKLEPVGYWKGGRPIYPIKGGSEPAVEPVITVPVETPPQETPPAPQPQGRVFTEDDVARIRQEEKDKLYGKVSSLEEQLKKLADEAKARQDEAAAKAKAKADETEAKRLEEASAKDLLLEKEKEWKQQLEQLRQEAETERVFREKERELAALQQYIQRRVSEESDSIAPEVLPFVTGNTEAEVESSIEKAKAVTAQIIENIANSGVATPPQPNLRGVPVTGNVSAGGPLDGTQNSRSYSLEELRNLPVTSPEYLAVRKAYGIGGEGRDRGMF